MRPSRLLGSAVAAVFALLALMTQVGPDDAATRLSGWYTIITTLNAPRWLQYPLVDLIGTILFPLAAVACFFLFVWPYRNLEINLFEWLGNTEAPKPSSDGLLDVSLWVNHGSYFVWVAACLWADTKPVARIDENHPAYPALQKIKSAIDTGQIESMFGGSSMSSKVRREELLKLAHACNERPRFLFPNQDIQQATSVEESAFQGGFNKATFERSGSKETAILRLVQLRESGVVIRNDAYRLVSNADLGTWTSKVTNWMQNVIEAIKPINEAESIWFATLDTVPEPRVPIPRQFAAVGDADLRILISTFSQHDYRLARLESVLKKLGIGA